MTSRRSRPGDRTESPSDRFGVIARLVGPAMAGFPKEPPPELAAAANGGGHARVLDVRFAHQRSDIAAFDFFGQRLDQLRHFFQMRVDRERLAESLQRTLIVADLL